MKKREKSKRKLDDSTVEFLQEIGSTIVAFVLVFGAVRILRPDIWFA